MLLRYNPPEKSPAEIVSEILATCFPDAETGIDFTFGNGNFWATNKFPIKQKMSLLKGDFRDTKLADESYDVVIFDPPHNEDAGDASVMGQRFDTYDRGTLEGVIKAGAQEAWRVAKLGTIIKVCDQTHGQRFQWEWGWIVEALGLPYEMTHGTRRSSMEDPRWTVKGPPLSARSNGAVYLIHRKGDQKHIRFRKPTPAAQKGALKLAKEASARVESMIKTMIDQRTDELCRTPNAHELALPIGNDDAVMLDLADVYEALEAMIGAFE